MKRTQLLAACCVLIPTALRAQDVKVRLYTNRPPEELMVRALAGEVRWRTCPTCAEKVARELKIAGRAGPRDGMDEVYVSGHYELRPVSGMPLAAADAAHIVRRDGHLLVTVTMPLEEYVTHVLMGESGAFENTESQKAMAVVARTYATRFAGQHANDGFDFCDTTHCQVFGWKSVNAAVQAAVNATRGEILRYQGKAAEAFYTQNCGGRTAAAQEVWPGVTEPYLTAHEDSYCGAHGAMLWETTLGVDEVERALRAAALKTPAGWQRVEISERSESGRALRLKLVGGAGGNALVSGSTFRFAVNRELGWDKIRSGLFEVRNTGNDVVFSGRGAGHGVGLCQAGAEEMGREGKSYQEILSFYYPGTEVVETQAGFGGSTQTAVWQKRSSERVELVSTQAESDAAILPVAERVLQQDEEAIGWKASAGAQLRVYATLDAYRNTTGQPGWVAATTRGRTVRLQPLKELEKRGIVESTLRHEMLHVLVEEKAKAATPLWFREGIVLLLSNAPIPAAVEMTDEEIEAVLRAPRSREEMQKAYAAAQNRVAGLAQQYGKETVLGWLSSGIPGDVRGGAKGSGVTSHR